MDPPDYDSDLPDDGSPDSSPGYADDTPEAERRALGRTNLPGVFLIVCGVFNLLFAGLLAWSAVNTYLLSDAELEFRLKSGSDAINNLMPGFGKQFNEEVERIPLDQHRRRSVMSNTGGAALWLLAGLLPILGGVRMRQLRSYGLSITGAIMAAVPCLSVAGCCGFGLGIGIWALVVLANPEVRSQFR